MRRSRDGGSEEGRDGGSEEGREEGREGDNVQGHAAGISCAILIDIDVASSASRCE